MKAVNIPEIGIDATTLSAVAATDRHPTKTSERFGFVPTTQMIEALRDAGMVPVSARQANTRIEENQGYQKHIVVFRFAETVVRNLNVNEEIPQLMLVNSHLGSASFQLLLSMWRCVCSNQLVVKSSALADIRIGHNIRAPELAAASVKDVIEVLPRVTENVQRFKAIELNTAERRAYVESALPLRFDAESTEVAIDDVLRPRRQADAAPTLWNTFNVVQEKFIRGGLRTTTTDENGRMRRGTARAVKSLNTDLKLNTALWTLTERMAEIKSAN